MICALIVPSLSVSLSDMCTRVSLSFPIASFATAATTAQSMPPLIPITTPSFSSLSVH
jgi:hypothetical protein